MLYDAVAVVAVVAVVVRPWFFSSFLLPSSLTLSTSSRHKHGRSPRQVLQRLCTTATLGRRSSL